MLETVALGAALGGLITMIRRWRAEDRETRSRERWAAILIHEELTAAISALDCALRQDDARWLASMSQSATLTEVWHQHGRALVHLDPKQWAAVDEAVIAMAPRPALNSVETDITPRRRSLIRTRRRLIEGVRLLQAVLDQLPTDERRSESAQLRSLLG